MSSNRLPGKVLREVCAVPMIVMQVRRLARCQKLDRLVVATSLHESDDILFETCQQYDIECIRGPLDDVLSRFEAVVKEIPTDHIVRLTGDCPLIDPEIVDQLIQQHLEADVDYTSNALDRTYPKGLDCEVFRVDALNRLVGEDLTDFDREHVTYRMYQPDSGYTVSKMKQEDCQEFMRWTVDYPEDFLFVEKVYEELYPENPDFSSKDILALLKRKPQLCLINADHLSKEQSVFLRQYFNI